MSVVLGTHYDECWRDHPACAVLMVERLQAQLAERDNRIQSLLTVVRIWIERDKVISRSADKNMAEAGAILEEAKT